MIAVWWVVVVAALGVCWTIWRFVRYPGGWAYAFHGEHREARRALEEAREALRERRGAARRERWRARAAVRRAEWAYRRRIRRAEAGLEQLRTPQPGKLVAQLGGIALHENTLAVSDEEVRLADVQVRFELARSKEVAYVYVTLPDGREVMETYDGKEFTEDAVRRFSVRIHNAAVAAGPPAERRAGEIRALEAELKRARKATEHVQAAEERLEETRARHDADVTIPRARAALDDARDTWQELTGRRPL
jgi:hypothetical protein